MELALFFVLLMGACCRSESTEKNLDTILDELLEETAVSKEKVHLNDSKIIYVEPDNDTRRQLSNDVESQSNTFPFEDSDTKDTTDKKTDTTVPSLGEVTSLGAQSDRGIKEELPTQHKGTSIQHNNHINIYNAEIGSHLLHQYPEAVINKIHANENRMLKDGNSLDIADNLLIKRQKEADMASKTLDKVLKILLNKVSKPIARTSLSQEDDQDLVLKSGFAYNDQGNDLYNQMPIVYPPFNEQRFVAPMPPQYENLLVNTVIHKPRHTTYVDPNEQLMEWASRSSNVVPSRRLLNRLRVYPKPLNFLPRRRRVYRPPYFRHYHLL